MHVRLELVGGQSIDNRSWQEGEIVQNYEVHLYSWATVCM